MKRGLRSREIERETCRLRSEVDSPRHNRRGGLAINSSRGARQSIYIEASRLLMSVTRSVSKTVGSSPRASDSSSR